MKKLFAYYDIPATLHLPTQTKPWREWPHVYLANMAINESSLRDLQSTFGLPKPIPEAEVRNVQAKLRESWKRAAAGITQAKLTPYPGLRIFFTPEGELEIIAENLLTYLLVAFLRDATAGRAKICANPECLKPYFLQTKGGQIYCSHRCAVRENVRRFRQQQESKPGTRKEGKK